MRPATLAASMTPGESRSLSRCPMDSRVARSSPLTLTQHSPARSSSNLSIILFLESVGYRYKFNSERVRIHFFAVSLIFLGRVPSIAALYLRTILLTGTKRLPHPKSFIFTSSLSAIRARYIVIDVVDTALDILCEINDLSSQLCQLGRFRPWLSSMLSSGTTPSSSVRSTISTILTILDGNLICHSTSPWRLRRSRKEESKSAVCGVVHEEARIH